MTIFDITHPDDLEKTIEFKNRFQKNTDQMKRFEKRYIHKSGKILWALVTSRLVETQSKENRFLFSAIENITEIRERDSELRAAHAQLISSSKMAALGEMAGGIAHEINTPLAIINSRAELIENRLLKGDHDINKIVIDLKSIKTTSVRIAKIIRGLRSFSRNSENDAMQTLSISKIIDETVVLCKERFKSHNTELRVNCTNGCSIECRGTQISQILMNLLNNAFDAVSSLTEKWISIDASSNENSVTIKVADSGKGIPPSIAEKIMEPFFTTKEVGQGTGLGLSISKGIAESHHGKLSYDPSSRNTCFFLELPLKQPHST